TAFRLAVGNSGNSSAARVKIHAAFSAGLEHAGGNKIEFDVGDLAAGESRNVTLLCVARGGGPQKLEAVAVADGGLHPHDTGAVAVSVPAVNAPPAGPGPRLPRRKPISLEGKVILSAGEDTTIRVWDAVTGAEVRTLVGHSGAVLALACSPDGKL